MNVRNVKEEFKKNKKQEKQEFTFFNFEYLFETHKISWKDRHYLNLSLVKEPSPS